MTRSLKRLLAPRSLAVIGGKEARRVVEQCIKMGFSGQIWPVHPSRGEVHGHTCFRSIDELPRAPDAAYVAVNRERTIGIISHLAARGCGGAVCYAAGFAEADSEDDGAADLQAQLLTAAGDMPVIGPNCYGFINALEGAALWPDQHGSRRVDSGVAILTQSSNLAISLTMQQRGLPVAFTGTLGNQAQTGLSELAYGLLEDDRITALGLHIEGLDDVRDFELLALRARELQKPVVALKVGRSEQAQTATLTHTSSLAGGDNAHQALFTRLGVARADTIDQFLETLKLLHCGGALHGNNLVSLSCSGGEAALMADAAENHDIAFPPFNTNATAALKAELGSIVTIANPLDYNTFIWGDWAAMQRMFVAAMNADSSLALLVLDFPRDDICDPQDWQYALDTWIAAGIETGKRTAVVASMAENMPESVASRLMENSVTPLCGLDTALAATAAAANIGTIWAKPQPPPLLVRHSRSGRTDAEDFIALNEHQSKRELAAFGLVVPKAEILTSGSMFLAGLEPPFALKALGIAHKTESGAVRLNLQTSDEIKTGLEEMSHLAREFLLEEMAASPDAELIVGISRDPVVGLMMTIGAGGVMAELLDDTVTLLLPAIESEIRAALSGLRINRLLEGWRGSKATDIDALIANIICIADYAMANAETLEELDVNPLFATQYGSIAVDALIVKRKPQ